MSDNSTTSSATNTTTDLIQNPVESKDSNDGHEPLTRQETRQILTPFAFKIDETLFGVALAKPWKRGLAILIDLFLIASLSEMPGEVLALVIAITMFKLGSKKRAQQLGKVKGRKRRAIMRFFGAFILFIVLVSTLPKYFNDFTSGDDSSVITSSDNGQVLTGAESLEFAALVLEVTAKLGGSECDSTACWQKELIPVVDKAKTLSLEREVVADSLESITEETALNNQEQKQLKQELLNYFDSLSVKDGVAVNAASLPASPQNDKSKRDTEKVTTLDSVKQSDAKKEDKDISSIMNWVKGIIEDLGLEFGWAAFYFTAFTALWKGQTPGKKLLRIKVLQLDGTPLSLSDSFGRYGGYGAGIATGLLGFLQIYWDPNRQAMHDKISATVVMDLMSKNAEQ